MNNTFKYTVLSIIRERNVAIWVILFPLVLATLFNAMLRGLDDTAYSLSTIPVAIVNGSKDNTGEAFEAMLKALSNDKGENALLAPIYVNTADEAYQLSKSGETIGIISLDAEGWPRLELSPVTSEVGISMEQMKRTVLADVVDGFCRSREAVEDIFENNPTMLANSSLIESLNTREQYTTELAITHSKTKEYVRYFYALLGYAGLMTAMVSLNAVGAIQPSVSPLGARRAVSGTSRARMLSGAIAASWVVSFGALVVAFVYIRFVLGVEFGGRESACVLGMAVAALMATSLGSLISTMPFIPSDTKGGLLTGITCLLSLFAGLYGPPALHLADQIAHEAPWAAAINPAKQVSDLFYSLYVYTDMQPFFRIVCMLLVTTAIFAGAAMLLIRRQKHASL